MKKIAGSFEGWNIIAFLKGREKLIVAAVGYVVGYITTNHPVYAGITSAGAELLYAIIKYYVKER